MGFYKEENSNYGYIADAKPCSCQKKHNQYGYVSDSPAAHIDLSPQEQAVLNAIARRQMEANPNGGINPIVVPVQASPSRVNGLYGLGSWELKSLQEEIKNIEKNLPEWRRINPAIVKGAEEELAKLKQMEQEMLRTVGGGGGGTTTTNSSSGESWFTQDTLIKNVPNWGTLTGGAAVVATAIYLATS